MSRQDDFDRLRYERAPATSPEENGHAKRSHSKPPPRMQWMDLSNWDNEARPEREWAIRDRVPLKQVGLFSGEGGTGKSILEMTKNVAHVAGKDWLGSMPEPRPAFYFGAEDDENEIHIRFYDIAKHYGVTFNQLVADGLYVRCLFNEDATLCTVSRDGKVEVTGLYRQLYQEAGDIKPINISVDTLTHAFAGSEIDRVQVYAFAMHMRRLAKVANGSVTVLSHPSLHGISSGSGISGSTAWHNAFRFRMYLRGVKEEGVDEAASKLRELAFKKNQYGPLGETITIEYRNGLYLPVHAIGGLEKVAADQSTDDLFLEMLAKFQAQGRNVSHNKQSPTYAPAAFISDPKVAKTPNGKKALGQAMERLFTAKKIRSENYGKPSRPLYRLVTVEGETA
jgi:RecA-family ATPase